MSSGENVVNILGKQLNTLMQCLIIFVEKNQIKGIKRYCFGKIPYGKQCCDLFFCEIR